MPSETPFGSLESLVSRTFEKDGWHRTIDNIRLFSDAGRRLSQPRVVWVNYEEDRRNGYFIRHECSVRRMLRWLSKAKEVTP
jgi:hypothetical protein